MAETHYERITRLSKEAKDLTKNCKEHNCSYLKRFAGSCSSKYEIYLQYYCGYWDITGHARLKEPENVDPNKCTHWQDDVLTSTKTRLIVNNFLRRN